MFEGFPDEAFAFLRHLAAEQNKPWFEANKGVYDDAVRWPLTALIADLTSEFTRLGIPLQGDPRRSVFRIHRDVRFARDKAPYKTNAGAVLTGDGGMGSPGLLYIHIQPGRCFTACGFYRPDIEPLQLIRDTTVARPQAYRKLLRTLSDRGLHLAVDEDALKRTPRGFDSVTDADLADAVRRRSFIVREELARQEVASAALVRRLTDFAQRALPLLSFGWKALGVDHAPPRGLPVSPTITKGGPA
ncbi:MAG TPA: TIGR02453 family protein [Rhodopila sp.]|uniref:DUF2461 domain-containing protein n=1 Tax=Rhodopila sp. TaxID=2480087 RepID=UPI002BB0806C|nr:TIGR02453 family protein [Rhodopila sp.]HVY14346.1 TIGR02453 family protein [Rhodopila sp.]